MGLSIAMLSKGIAPAVDLAFMIGSPHVFYQAPKNSICKVANLLCSLSKFYCNDIHKHVAPLVFIVTGAAK